MQIYIHRNNQQLGPFTEAEVRAQLASGTLSLQDHVWYQGLPNWMPLGQSPLAAAPVPGLTPLPGAPAVPYPAAIQAPTSKLAVWALVCGCLSLLCGLFASIPAIVLGHMGLSETRKNPALQGRGMALGGMILGYVFTALIVIYLVCVVVLIALGSQVKAVFKTINSQVESAQMTNSADSSATVPDQTTNSPDQSATMPSTTNSPDQSTNSAPTGTNSPDQTTNSPPSGASSPGSAVGAVPGTNAPAVATP
jgi:uncharacterized membrane protein